MKDACYCHGILCMLAPALQVVVGSASVLEVLLTRARRVSFELRSAPAFMAILHSTSLSNVSYILTDFTRPNGSEHCQRNTRL
jgi:hypothetical protein